MYPVTYPIFLGLYILEDFLLAHPCSLHCFFENTLCNLRALWLSVVDHMGYWLMVDGGWLVVSF